MTHRAKQQSMNAGRRNTNALKADLQMLGPEIVKKSEEKIEDLTIRLDSPNLSENNKR